MSSLSGSLQAAVLVIATVIVVEAVAAATHRWLMHGPGWGWHRSHHEPRQGLTERNDLFAVAFAAVAAVPFAAAAVWPPARWIGIGAALYGLLYLLLHECLVHRRIPIPWVPRSGYLKRLIQAHRLHHAVTTRDGCVSFGFLYAPPVARLADALGADRRREADRTP